MANMIQIDGAKLRGLIEARGIKMASVSRELGYTSEYIKQCVARNNISQGSMKMLQVLFGFNPDDYKWEEPKPVQTAAPADDTAAEVNPVYTPVAALDMSELQQAIALACKQTKAPEIDYSRIRDAVCEGFLDATYQLINNSEQRNMITGLLSHCVKVGMAMNLDERLRKAGGKA